MLTVAGKLKWPDLADFIFLYLKSVYLKMFILVFTFIDLFLFYLRSLWMFLWNPAGSSFIELVLLNKKKDWLNSESQIYSALKYSFKIVCTELVNVFA